MYVEVLVEIKAKQLDKTFTYEVPLAIQKVILCGMRVLVPFGSLVLEGYVLKIKDNCEEGFEIKQIIDIIDEFPVLNEEMLKLGMWLKEETFGSLCSCYAAMLPKALKAERKTNIKKKYVTYLVLNNMVNSSYSKAQEQVLNLFVNQSKVLKSEAKKISSSAVQTLLNKQVLKEEQEEVFRYQLQSLEPETKKKLNEEQRKALSSLEASLGQSKTILLHGVTGSGKTEVYLQIIDDVLKRGQTALVLVPEISLTPQFVERFQKRFPNQIAVLHSGLNDGEKYDEWRKILKEETSIVIGARSAVFAPLKNIGIIILDEEHADSYKQENNPKYHARNVALKRSETWSCPVVLGSATPSFYSMARAMKQRYDYIPLKNRALGNALPKVTLVDMAEEMKHQYPILSRALQMAIQERLTKNEQVVLLLNRRGHSTYISCSNCGFTYKCPYCDISLTFHKTNQTLRCHYCGYTKHLDAVCPKCREDGLNYLGLGTEKLEEFLSKTFLDAKIIRMDADSTSKKGDYEKIINDFKEEKYNILLGTQMVSKGLDFPNVTLVGIINADATLNIPDYKSNERCFDLLAQASGRAGRSNKNGEVYIQAFNYQHPVLQYVIKHDYKSFFTYEMNIRKTLKYPPFYYLARLKVRGKDYQKLSKEVVKIKEYLKRNLKDDIYILGPALSNPFVVNKIYNFELLLKYRATNVLLPILKQLDGLYLMNKDINLDIDLHY